MLPPLSQLFAGLTEASGLVLAVSGGPDSTALLHLVAAWRPSHLPVCVAVVDHGLRPEARREAEGVVTAASALDLNAAILTWISEKPQGRLQERAREARYRLLRDYARSVGASHLVTAHTLDDQAETLLMRIAAGSGPRGLIGMRPHVSQGGIVTARPFLTLRKSVLVELCRNRGWPFIEDPSNADPRFARVRWRQLADSLAAEGVTPERLSLLAARMARSDAALASIAGAAIRTCVQRRQDGAYILATALFEQPDEIVLRVLATLLHEVAPQMAPRLHKLERLLDSLRLARAAAKPLRRTLQGCVIALAPSGSLTLRPEPPRRSASPLLNANS